MNFIHLLLTALALFLVRVEALPTLSEVDVTDMELLYRAQRQGNDCETKVFNQLHPINLKMSAKWLKHLE